jgi:hypothetical protein
MYVAPQGYTFWARDFTGIEAVLVGYFANSARYTRLAKIGVHDYFNAHMLLSNKKITNADMPDLKWTDGDLKLCFGALKKRFKAERDTAKRCVHLSNYRGTPHRMHKEYPETFPTIKAASLIQGAYYELFWEIPSWHGSLCLTVDGSVDPDNRWQCLSGEAGSGWVRNPFGGVHRFWDVINFKPDRYGNPDWDYGEDAKRLIAYLPQSTASAIMKLALVALWVYPHSLEEARGWGDQFMLRYTAPSHMVSESLRLSIHDEILGMCFVHNLGECLGVSGSIMERPWKELPLNPAWGMGEFLSIGTGAKHGPCWGTMVEE